MTLGLNPVQTLARIAQSRDEHPAEYPGRGEASQRGPGLTLDSIWNSSQFNETFACYYLYTLNGSYFYACVEYVCMKFIFVNDYVCIKT